MLTPGLHLLALGLVVFTGVAGQIALGHLSDRIGREWVWSLAAGGFALYLDGERAVVESSGRVLYGPCQSATPLPTAPRRY